MSIDTIAVCHDPLFVLGAPRSGTSMMQWALRQHPSFWGGQESDYLVPLVESLREVHEMGSRRGRLHWLSGQKVAWDEFLVSVGHGVNSLYTNRSQGLRWVEQTPQYTLHLDDIAAMFPGASFVIMLRDGRSVVESLRNFVNPVGHDEGAELWRRFVIAGQAFADEHPERALVVRYERVVADTDAEMRRVYDFLGEPHEQDSVSFIRDRSPINSSFDAGSRSAGERWAAWGLEERRRFHDIAGDQLIRFGMERDDSWVLNGMTAGKDVR